MLRAEILRELDRIELVRAQLKVVEQARDALLRTKTPGSENPAALLIKPHRDRPTRPTGSDARKPCAIISTVSASFPPPEPLPLDRSINHRAVLPDVPYRLSPVKGAWRR